MSEPKRLLLIGAGAHAREVAEILRQLGSVPGRAFVGVVADGGGDHDLLEGRGIRVSAVSRMRQRMVTRL